MPAIRAVGVGVKHKSGQRTVELNLLAPVADEVGLAVIDQLHPQIVGAGIVDAGINVAERIQPRCVQRLVGAVRAADRGDEHSRLDTIVREIITNFLGVKTGQEIFGNCSILDTALGAIDKSADAVSCRNITTGNA